MAGRELDTAVRVSSTGKRLAAANVHGQLVSDWVVTFAPIIWQMYAPTRWPPALVLDETEFRVGQPGAARGRLAFVVLAAVGYPAIGQPYVAAIEAVPRMSVPAWRTLLGSQTGAPDRVVTDGGLARRAVERVWPATSEGAPQLWRCEWQLARNITASLPGDVQRDPTDPVHNLIRTCQLDPTRWKALNNEIAKRATSTGYLNTVKTLRSVQDLISGQAATRPTSGPHSSGALEQFFHQLDGTIADRAARLTNKPRTDALLHLLAAHRNGWADENAWAAILRHHLLAHHGYAPAQRPATPSRPAEQLRAPRPEPVTVDF